MALSGEHDPAARVALAAAPAGERAAADVLAADEHERRALLAAAAAHPEASAALAVLLRGSEGRSVADGLLVESATYSTLQAGREAATWLAGSRRSRARPRGASLHPPVALHRDGDVLHLVLDRPEVHNAYSAEMRDLLLDGLAVAAADPAVRVVLRGRGPSFCSGGDLAEFGTTPDPATAHLIRLRRSVGAALAAVAGRVEVRLHGACVGAGIELAAFAARVVATRDTRIRLPELSMGLVPGAGGTVSIPRRIGRQRTMWLALSGAWVDAATAWSWGLVDEVVDVHPRT